MPPRNIQRQKPLRTNEIVELVNIPDGYESEDDLEDIESEEEGVQSSTTSSTSM